MPRFVFELEAVLKQRLAEERERQLAVAVLERERQQLEDLIRTYQRDLTSERDELREQLAATQARSATLDFRGVRFQAGASLRLVTMAQRAVLQLAGVHKKIDAARLLLLQATTRRKGVEMLKERRHEEWKLEQRKREEAALDELNVVRASRTEEPL
ncbi:MAG TPA: flagellar FliJ family protein [Phycisphaerales bacterium]|nr:flagellar FliJ family protein [Phycisphaerales bacterium]